MHLFYMYHLSSLPGMVYLSFIHILYQCDAKASECFYNVAGGVYRSCLSSTCTGVKAGGARPPPPPLEGWHLPVLYTCTHNYIIMYKDKLIAIWIGGYF